MKRQIKDGAGAGYEIDSVLTDLNVIDATLSGIKIRETAYGDKFAVIQCDIECTANIKSAFSYMYGRELDIKTPCKITAVAVNTDYLDNENGQDAADFIYQALDNYGVELKVKEYYGGGWSHSKYDGTVCEINDANGYVSTLNAEDFPSGIIALDASISNSRIIDFIDRLVSDNATNVFYAVCRGHSNSDNALEYFDKEVDADRYAEELSEENKGTEYRIIEVTEYEDENGDIYDIEEEERGSYYLDEDDDEFEDDEFEDDEITDSVRRVKDNDAQNGIIVTNAEIEKGVNPNKLPKGLMYPDYFEDNTYFVRYSLWVGSDELEKYEEFSAPEIIISQAERIYEQNPDESVRVCCDIMSDEGIENTWFVWEDGQFLYKN